MKLIVQDIRGNVYEHFVDDAKPLAFDGNLSIGAYKLFDKKFTSGLGIAILDSENKSLCVIDNRNRTRSYYNLKKIIKFDFVS